MTINVYQSNHKFQNLLLRHLFSAMGFPSKGGVPFLSQSQATDRQMNESEQYKVGQILTLLLIALCHVITVTHSMSSASWIKSTLSRIRSNLFGCCSPEINTRKVLNAKKKKRKKKRRK